MRWEQTIGAGFVNRQHEVRKVKQMVWRHDPPGNGMALLDGMQVQDINMFQWMAIAEGYKTGFAK